jgi:hypothetical protein
MNHHDLSEVVFGLVLEARVPVESVRPEFFDVPYDKGIEILSKKGATREDVAKVLNSRFISDAHDAVHKWNGISEKENFDWVKALVDADYHLSLSKRLDKASKRLRENDDVDLLPLFGELSSAVSGQQSGLRPLAEVDIENYKPFMDCGDPVFDAILGNFPNDGPVVAYGKTGVGKSFWLASKVDYFLHLHTEKRAAIYTLEMSEEHWKHRNYSMYPSLRDVEDRLYVSGVVSKIEQIVMEVMTGKFDLVGIDDMDNLVSQSSPDEYERVYRKIKEICRFMKIPVIVLAQPNRTAKLSGKFLGQFDTAWSGAAENSAGLLIALQKANSIDMKDDDMFPSFDTDHFYEICWKSRDGWPVMQGPGCIIRQVGNRMWRGKPYMNKAQLWMPNATGKSIGKKRKSED